jgi:hypothetical protein
MMVNSPLLIINQQTAKTDCFLQDELVSGCKLIVQSVQANFGPPICKAANRTDNDRIFFLRKMPPTNTWRQINLQKNESTYCHYARIVLSKL